MAFGQALQRLKRTDDQQEIGVGIQRFGSFRKSVDYKIAHTSAVEVGDVLVPVAQAGTEGKKQAAFRKSQGTAVGQKPADFGSCVAETVRTGEGGDFLNGIMHGVYLFLSEKCF